MLRGAYYVLREIVGRSLFVLLSFTEWAQIAIRSCLPRSFERTYSIEPKTKHATRNTHHALFSALHGDFDHHLVAQPVGAIERGEAFANVLQR
jgi:hypothetical protein